MAVPVSNYTVAALEDETGLGLYTFGGRDATGVTSTVVQVFYPATGDTAVLEDDPWPGTTPSECVSLPATGVAVVDNMAYALGGMSFSTSVPPCVDDVSKEVWRFNPNGADGNKWKKQPALKVARGYITAAVVDGNRIFAIGGDLNEAGTLVAQPTVESWKIGAKKWNDTNYADLPSPVTRRRRSRSTAVRSAARSPLAGCGQWPAAVPDVVQYDVADDSWSTVGALLEARRNHAGVNIGTAAAAEAARGRRLRRRRRYRAHDDRDRHGRCGAVRRQRAQPGAGTGPGSDRHGLLTDRSADACLGTAIGDASGRAPHRCVRRRLGRRSRRRGPGCRGRRARSCRRAGAPRPRPARTAPAGSAVTPARAAPTRRRPSPAGS